MNKQEIYDVVIIGAGPAGISCALAAKRKNLKCIMVDKGNVVDAIIRFPINMTFFSTSDKLELDNIPFTSATFRPSRNETVRYYHNIVIMKNLPFMTDSAVYNITTQNNNFVTHFVKAKKDRSLISKNIIIATGFYDSPNMLNVPGENLTHVTHYFSDALYYFGKKVVVVGGKNSAVEAALDLFRLGAEVTIVHRGKEIKENVKYWILPDIQNRIASGEIKIYLESHLEVINTESVVLICKGKRISLACDAVLLLTGYHPETALMESIGVKYNKDTLIPDFDEKTLQSNIKGVYLAGSILAGKNPNKIFIENSREHGEKIINHISKSI